LRKFIQEGLDLAQDLTALPFKAARQALQETPLSGRPIGDVVMDSLYLGEGLARLPLKATAALMAEFPGGPSDLERRVAVLEQRLGVATPTQSPP
jgi:hypothetical protein